MFRIINYLRRIFLKLIGKQETKLSVIDYNFLRNTAKLALRERVIVYKGGYKALTDALYDVDNAVFILIIKKSKTKKAYNLRRWFRNFR